MLGKLLFFLFIVISLSVTYAQEKQEYLGLVIVNDSVSISYRVSLSEKNGNVEGYSLTDLGGEHETRSNIHGEYDAQKKVLNFRETDIVYTKSFINQDDFCFINTTVANFSFNKKGKYKTNFVGLFSDNTQCVNGQLMLTSLDRVEAKFSKVVQKVNKSKKLGDSIKQKLNSIKLMDSLKMNVLRKEEVMSIFSNSENIELSIFDGGKEDGDNISILVNGKTVLSNYEAKRQKKVLTINLVKAKTSIVIKAENEGAIAPNTVVIEFRDNKNQIKALSNLKQGETTQVDILKSK